MNLAGFFGLFDYDRPGPGVSKNGPQKHRFFIFFDIFSRKFWSLVRLNMLYVVSIILFFIPLLLVIIQAAMGLDSGDFFIKYSYNGTIMTLINPYIMVYALPVAFAGPATSGFTYILRNFAREEHAFLWMDYKDTIKKNWKQSLIVAFINVVVIMILTLTIPFYFQSVKTNQLFLIPLVLCIIISCIFLFMHYYIYLMIITFDLKIKQIYKNAAIFAIMGIGKNILLTLAIAFWAVFTYTLPVLGTILLLFLTMSFLGLQINFSSWPLIEKFMIDPYNKKAEEENENTEPVFEDKGKEI